MNLNNTISYTYTHAIRQPKDVKKNWSPSISQITPTPKPPAKQPPNPSHARFPNTPSPASSHLAPHPPKTPCCPRRQIPVHNRKDARSADAGPARQRTRGRNRALPLGRRQREAGPAGRRREGRARAGSVPYPVDDDAAVRRAARDDVQVAFTRKRARGACRGGGSAGLGAGTAGGAAGDRGAAFRQVLDPRGGAGGFGAVGVGRNEGAGLHGAAHVVVVPDFVEGAGAAAQSDGEAPAVGAKRGLDLR